MGDNSTLIVCPLCSVRPGQELFARLFYGRRVGACGATVAMSYLHLPNDVGAVSEAERADNKASLADYHQHFLFAHPDASYEVRH